MSAGGRAFAGLLGAGRRLSIDDFDFDDDEYDRLQYVLDMEHEYARVVMFPLT